MEVSVSFASSLRYHLNKNPRNPEPLGKVAGSAPELVWTR